MKPVGMDGGPGPANIEFAGRAKCRMARVINYEAIQQNMVEGLEDESGEVENLQLSDKTDEIQEGIMTRARLRMIAETRGKWWKQKL